MSEEQQLTTTASSLGNLDQDMKQISAMLNEYIGPGKLTKFQLGQLRVPSSGGMFFTVQDVEGEKSVPTIRCIILMAQYNRAYYKKSLDAGGTSAPDCSSEDGEVGIGDPGGVCEECPFDKFGSKGAGKACGERFSLYILRDGILPEVLQVPVTSLKNWQKFAMMFAGKGRKSYSFMTQIGLEKAENSNGVKYTKLTFRAVPAEESGVDAGSVAKLEMYVKEFSRLIGADKPTPAAKQTIQGPAFE